MTERWLALFRAGIRRGFLGRSPLSDEEPYRDGYELGSELAGWVPEEPRIENGRTVH
jgi:hypothetical protein